MSLAAASEVSKLAVVAVLSVMEGTFTLEEEQRTALKDNICGFTPDLSWQEFS